MQNLNLLVGKNLRTIREELRLSLDKVADLTGVSKSMLGQIERGETSPTITTIWKIANGLKISFTTLTKGETAPVSVISENDLNPIKEDDGRYTLYPVFPFDPHTKFEMYRVELQPGCVFEAEPHLKGEEYVIVFEGELQLSIGDETYLIAQGDALKFKADKPHVYINKGKVITKVSMLIYYP